jgi:hypothetical protein
MDPFLHPALSNLLSHRKANLVSFRRLPLSILLVRGPWVAPDSVETAIASAVEPAVAVAAVATYSVAMT